MSNNLETKFVKYKDAKGIEFTALIKKDYPDGTMDISVYRVAQDPLLVKGISFGKNCKLFGDTAKVYPDIKDIKGPND